MILRNTSQALERSFSSRAGVSCSVSGAPKRLHQPDQIAKTTENQRFCGVATYYGYRYYTPQTGRWINRDPIEEKGHELIRGHSNFTDVRGISDANSYGFSLNSSTSLIDADGRIIPFFAIAALVFFSTTQWAVAPTSGAEAADPRWQEPPDAAKAASFLLSILVPLDEVSVGAAIGSRYLGGIIVKIGEKICCKGKWFKQVVIRRSNPKVTKAGTKPSPKFKSPTNPPQMPPCDLPPGYKVVRQKPTQHYPNGNWKILKDMGPGSKGQRINPSTLKPGPHPDTHVEFPPGYKGPYDY
jgi:RHS repeat-associated protein